MLDFHHNTKHILLMNRLSLPIIMICIAWNCCSVKDPQRVGPIKNQGGEGSGLHRRSQSPNVIKQNISVIEGSIDSVIIVDDRNFRLVITISSSTPEEDIDSYADAGQQIIVVPEYFIGDDGMVDEKNSRNGKLLLLRAANSDDRIKAKVSLGKKGEWKIIEVLD